MKKHILLVFVMFFVFLQVSSVIADGGYFPPPGYWVRPGQQRAIIFHEDNTETLILTSGFQGNAKDLVWIVPTPTKPEVTKANEKIFTNIAELARQQRTYRIAYAGIMEAAGGVKELGVVVIESKQVDYYDVNILLATSSQDLAEWFNDNDYDYPEEYSYVLNHYINKGWYFTAIKISPEAQGATEVILDLKEGNPTPIKMVFLSDKVVFPLKISSVDFKPKDEVEYEPEYYYQYGDYVPIQLYVISDGKYEADGFYVQYGNWVKKSQIKDLGNDENGNPFLQPKNNKYFLTSLNANYQKSQMDDDIFLKKADNNKKVNAGPETWQLFLYGLLIACILFVAWFLTPLGILFIIGSLILFLSSNRTARVSGWIMEILSLSITVIITIIFFSIAAINNSLGNYVVVSFLITGLIIIGIMILLTSLQARYRK